MSMTASAQSGKKNNLGKTLQAGKEMFSSHPYTMKRIERAKAKAATYAK